MEPTAQIFDYKYFDSLHADFELCQNEAEVIEMLEIQFFKYEHSEKALPWINFLLDGFNSSQLLYDPLKPGFRYLIIQTLLTWEDAIKKLNDRKPETNRPAVTNCRISPQELRQLLPALIKGGYIDPATTEAQFLAPFISAVLPGERIRWTGSRKDCFSFMMDIYSDSIKANEVNSYFEQYATVNGSKKRNTKPLIPGDRTNCKRGFLDRLK